MWIHRWLLPLAKIYTVVVRGRTALYEHGLLSQKKLPCRVISVGNLTVGGTGKTPVVIWIVEQLLAAGRRVAVLSRGYKRQNPSRMVLVSDGKQLQAPPDEAGDEPYLIARRCPTAVVAVGDSRYKLGQWVLDRFPVDCCVLDDGFQHLALFRDVNVLLVDASDADGLKAVLPAGRLREPLSGAARATAVLVTRANQHTEADRVLQLIRRELTGLPPSGICRFSAEGLIQLRTGARKELDQARGRTVVAFSGIGNARSFRDLLEQHGMKIVEEIVFSDHHAYRPADLDTVRSAATRQRAELIMTTEKDGVKVEPLMTPEDEFWTVRLTTDIMVGRERLQALILGK